MTDETEIQTDTASEITAPEVEAPVTDAPADDSSDDTSDEVEAVEATTVIVLPAGADEPDNGQFRPHRAHAKFGFDERRVGRFQP